jgi:hypothetical protein
VRCTLPPTSFLHLLTSSVAMDYFEYHLLLAYYIGSYIDASSATLENSKQKTEIF